MSAFLPGFAFRGFRSFYGDMQIIGPLSQINMLAGQNNSGKSNVLRFVQNILDAIRPFQPSLFDLKGLDGLDLPVGSDGSLEFAVATRLTPDVLSRLPERSQAMSAPARQAVEGIFSSPAFKWGSDDLIWTRFEPAPANPPALRSPMVRYTVAARQLDEALAAISQHITGYLGTAVQTFQNQTGSPHHNLLSLIDALEPFTSIPPVVTIDAIRQVRHHQSGEPPKTTSGEGLILALAGLQHPDVSQQEDRRKFDAINRFVQVVLDDPSAAIEVPHHGNTLNVRQGSLLLPLENLGTGIHEVVILAAAATLQQHSLVCIEEPEIHLHPILQRKLVDYLRRETNNQYLIATHSAHLLDPDLGSIFHVTSSGDGSEVLLAASPHQLARICADLGYRASDLVQSNAVLWVEGPSDRIYLRHWIGLVAPELREGIDFSIMFYGGALLSHLTPEDPEVEEFVSLRRLNRYLAIVIDSDRRHAGASLTPTKRRIREGFAEAPGFAWITRGYTIENYVPTDLLQAAVKAVSQRLCVWDGDLYTNPLDVSSVHGATTPINKVAVARAVVDMWDAKYPLSSDLSRQVMRCVSMIREANRR